MVQEWKPDVNSQVWIVQSVLQRKGKRHPLENIQHDCRKVGVLRFLTEVNI